MLLGHFDCDIDKEKVSNSEFYVFSFYLEVLSTSIIHCPDPHVRYGIQGGGEQDDGNKTCHRYELLIIGSNNHNHKRSEI